MKNKTIKKLLIAGLVCAFCCAIFGLLAVAMGMNSFIIAFVTGIAATLPICAELAATDKRIAAERENQEDRA